MSGGKSNKDGVLSPKRQRFVEEYLVDFNGAAAWVRAGYSPNGAGQSASHLLKDPLVQKAIDAGRKAMAERTGVTADMVRKELAKIAFSDISKLFETDGSLKPVHDLDPEMRSAVAGLETTEVALGETTTKILRKIKRYDKVKALELLGQDLGMFNNQTVNVPVTIQFDDPTQRPEDYQRRKHTNGNGSDSEH